MGNAHGVTQVSTDETWVTTAEWMQGPKGMLLPGNQYGSDSSVYQPVEKGVWNSPNVENTLDSVWLAKLQTPFSTGWYAARIRWKTPHRDSDRN